VAHVTSWLSRQGGGIPPVVWALARETSRRGFPCSVFGLKDQWTDQDCTGNHVPVVAGRIWGPKAIGFSPGLTAQLRAHIRPGGIIHSHGLWMHPGTAARKCAVKGRYPLVISPHGMLEPWALEHSRLKKRIAACLFEDKNLREANCLHALCEAEAGHFRRYGLKNPIAIIPNGVDMPELRSPTSDLRPPPWSGFIEPGQKVLLFLSRLHAKKGLANLLQAWQAVAGDFKDWRLLIAGAGQPAYEMELKARVKEYALEKSVLFLGPLQGRDKRQVLAAADAFVLPSFSEGFSVAILEAAAGGLPVLLTPECNFPELAKSGAAIEISPQATAVEQGLRQILKHSDAERKAMGQRGQDLVKQNYTWPVIAARMCRVYEWLAGNASRPDDVKG
jgi:poly(glycerol-phosphate) alpha-glucosyltransferase